VVTGQWKSSRGVKCYSVPGADDLRASAGRVTGSSDCGDRSHNSDTPMRRERDVLLASRGSGG
jgi:hypothetical protein